MRGGKPALLEMSFTVIITEGTKPAYKKGQKNGDGLGRRLTMVAQMNVKRIDFLRPQIAHALKAKMTVQRCVIRECS